MVDRRRRIEDRLLRIAEDHRIARLLIVADRPRMVEARRLIAQQRRRTMAVAPAVAAITAEAGVAPITAGAVAPTAEVVVADMPRPVEDMADTGKKTLGKSGDDSRFSID
jgi:hypothetical protein